MEVPDLVRERLGDEEITAGVSIGDEDAVCLTPTRTLIYRSEGILSDEEIEEYPHEAERLSMKEGRRKTKFVLEYVEGPESFTVPANRGDNVLELLLQGILRVDGVIDRTESIAGVYRFTELTLIVTEARILKHVGGHVWDDDFESYPFERVTGLSFERASNATSIAIEVDGRPQRVKVPNDTARVVRQTVEEALFAYYGVDSLEALNRTVGDESTGTDAGDGDGDEAGGSPDGIGFESGIDPLVTDSAEEQLDDVPDAPESSDRREGSEGSARPERMDVSLGSRSEEGDSTAADATRTETNDAGVESGGPDATGSETADSSARVDPEPSGDTDAGADAGRASDAAASGNEGADATAGAAESGPDGATADPHSTAEASGPADQSDGGASTGGASGELESADASDPRSGDSDGSQRVDPEAVLDYEPASREDLAAVTTQVEELTEAVERQNELLKRQHKAIKQLVTELRAERE